MASKDKEQVTNMKAAKHLHLEWNIKLLKVIETNQAANRLLVTNKD
jgi:hypothetical protein